LFLLLTYIPSSIGFKIKIKFTALSALLRLPRLESDGSLSSRLRDMKRNTKKYERFLILLKAVGNAHYVDKSRPYIQWTLADLFTDVIQNFLHSEKVNKSQTRIKSICHRFFTLSEPAVILK